MQPPKTIASKKKLNREDFMFKDKTGEELIKKPGQVNGLDFQIRNLTDCQVYLMDTTAQVSQYVNQISSFTFSEISWDWCLVNV